MKKKVLGMLLVLTLVVFPMIFSGNALAKEKYGIGFLGDLTGPLGFWNAPRMVGIQDAIEYMNKTYGGIGGREVFVEWEDTKSKIDIATSGYERLRSKGYPIWHTCGTGEQQILKQRYEADRSQAIYTCSTSPNVIYPPGYCFGTAAYYPDEWGLFTDWVVENWDFKKMGRNPRFAILTYGSGYGKACITKEFMAYAKKKGFEHVDTIFVPFVTVDAVTPLMKAKKKGADWCIGQWIYQTVPPYLNANYKLKLGLKFAVNTFGVDDVMIYNSSPREAAIGLTGITNWRLTWEDTPGLNIIREIWEKKNRRPEDRGASYILGWMNTWQTKRLIEETLARVGSWDKITAKEVRITSESWGDVDVHGLGSLTYGKNKRGTSDSRIAQVKKVKANGKEVIRWEYVTGWRKAPFLVPEEWQKPLPY
ncbi:MAG: ABC transporter substrate-binding protein [Desulfobacteraceae bacterium]|jgi:ABC-type branched-subunit amino acid transport system substrate-binding protein